MAFSVEELRGQIAGDIILPGDEAYEGAISRWSLCCIKEAGAVVMPTSTEDVSKTIRFANARSIPFTVCGGGHSTSGTSSIGPEGLVIDLRRMRSVSVDVAAKTVTFDGGCLWVDVDKATNAHGLATPGGTVSHTGVGGLVLGGGFGVLSGRHGLTVDCLVSVTVVMADGRVVVASEDSEPDLFWAMRGAGNSFGVATSFTSRCFEQAATVWGGTLVFTPDKLGDVVAATNEFLALQTGDQAMLLAAGFAPPGPPGPDGKTGERPRVVIVQCFHNGTAEDARARFFAPLLKLGPLMDATREMPYPAINTLMDEMASHRKRWLFGAANAVPPLSADVVRDAAEMLWSWVEANCSPTQELRDSVVGFELFAFDKIVEVPLEATAASNRGRYFNVMIGMCWTDADKDAEVRAFKQGLERAVRARGHRGIGGVGGVGQYNNYVSQPIAAEDAFGPNTRRLRELKAKYDPENRFDKLWRLVPESK